MHLELEPTWQEVASYLPAVCTNYIQSREGVSNHLPPHMRGLWSVKPRYRYKKIERRFTLLPGWRWVAGKSGKASEGVLRRRDDAAVAGVHSYRRTCRLASQEDRLTAASCLLHR